MMDGRPRIVLIGSSKRTNDSQTIGTSHSDIIMNGITANVLPMIIKMKSAVEFGTSRRRPIIPTGR